MGKKYIISNVIIAIVVYSMLWISIIWDYLDFILETEILLFIVSLLVSFTFFITTKIIKYFEEKKSNTIIILNLQKIPNYSNKIQSMEKISQNFKLNMGAFCVPTSIADYIVLISDSIKHTLHFTNLFGTISNINLIQDMFEILPELQKMVDELQKMSDEIENIDPTSFEKNFNSQLTLFHKKITKFEKFIVTEYSNDINNPGKYTSGFIKHDLELDPIK